MTVRALLKGVEVIDSQGNMDISFDKLHFDSRQVKKGDVFVAVKGTQVDGHKFIEKAVQQGAVAIIVETMPADTSRALFIKVKNAASALSFAAGNLYDHPSKKLKLIGITGTNGKTTTATLLLDLFKNLGFKTGLISTIENKINDEVIPATHTTPDAVAINDLLNEMVEAGCHYCFMEVSSHAVHQKRVEALHFTGGVFTNISHDHLDYHKTFDEYIAAKKGFFDNLPKTSFALTNVDDKRGRVMVQNSKAKIITYALRRVADLKARILDNNILGLHLILDGKEFHSRLIGEFNVYNLLSVYGVATELGIPEDEVLQNLSLLKSAEGRFDYVMNHEKGLTGIVDYAHTPDALQKVLETINQLKPKNAKVITVVGAGGDRDKSKRPKMAKIAAILSETLILTSDNPRSENPNDILDDMEKGLDERQIEQTLIISDRKQAIKTAVKMARKGDIILIAGKGHEKYQEIKGEKHPFDDKEILKSAFSQKK